MRTTQFIGYPGYAKELVRDLTPVDPDSFAIGMFDEKLPLKKWEPRNIKHDHPLHTARAVNEVVQTVPWSSGPMIFTCLEIEWQNGYKSRCCEWVANPMIRDEVNYELGHYWV